jgi:5'-3' exonuclease
MDDKTKTGNPDRELINTGENYEVEYWSNKFNVTPEQLKAAVKLVGNSVEQVKKQLNKQ